LPLPQQRVIPNALGVFGVVLSSLSLFITPVVA
jgi:hypothetical protein